jgi:hypothetical protein
MQPSNVLFTTTALATLLTLPQIAQSAGMNEYDELQSAPALFESDGSVTAIGLTARAAGTIYWSFFDPNGNGVASGSISVEQDQFTPFIWDANTAGGDDLIDVPGFVLFGLDTDGNGRIEPADGNNLGSNSFIIYPLDQDVVYGPTVNIDAADIAESDPALWTTLPTRNLDSADGKAADTGDVLDMQYLIDGAPLSGDDTQIAIFTTAKVPTLQTMTIHDGAGNSRTITVPFFFDRINVIDLEQMVAEDISDFLGGGYVRWMVPESTTGESVDAFAVIFVDSPAFGAIQTLLPNYVD